MKSMRVVILAGGVAMMGACAETPTTPSMVVREQIKVVTPAEGGEKKTFLRAGKLIVNGRKSLRTSSGDCVVETTLLVNVAKRRVGDVEVTLPKVRTERYPVVCAQSVAFEPTQDDVVQMDLEETWYVDQVQSTMHNGDQVLSISLAPLLVGRSVKRVEGGCREERQSLEKVDGQRMDETDVVVPTTRVETASVPCPAAYPSNREPAAAKP